jgi:hypothetical protein
MAEALRGAAALYEMLDLIGAEESDDHDMARVFCENEMNIRGLLAFLPAVLPDIP